MRLGVLMLGTGAQAAVHVGVMQELEQRGIEPFVVSGLLAGAWPAALCCAGADDLEWKKALKQAARMGPRLLDRRFMYAAGRGYALRGRRICRLLRVQTGDRLLTLAKRPGLFFARTASGGRRVIFASRSYAYECGATLSMQVSLGFAARAVMTLPPLLSPMEWMGGPLLAERNVGFVCRQMLAFGAQRVLVVAPEPAVRGAAKPEELLGCSEQWLDEGEWPEGAEVLRVPLPEGIGMFSMDALNRCAQEGRRAAEVGLDDVLRRMGMALCRVLPFPGSAAKRMGQ